jgi:two-component system, OmpR family, KDP operon response regulator KdpE
MADRPGDPRVASADTASGAAPAGPAVLLIEDEVQIRRFLRASLRGQGYRLLEAVTGDEGLLQAATRQPDLVVLDLGLPDLDGLEVLRRLREWSHVPVIVLSARGHERDKVAALDAGADDYVSKPFGIGELLARMRVALRHAARTAAGAEEPVFQAGDLRVDLARRRVSRGDTEVRLTPTEYRLLAVLVRHAGKVLTHRQLLREVWGPPYVEQTHYLRVYMTQLRHKLEADPTRPGLLLTEAGVGYRLHTE